jgi:hypothetical protein
MFGTVGNYVNVTADRGDPAVLAVSKHHTKYDFQVMIFQQQEDDCT